MPSRKSSYGPQLNWWDLVWYLLNSLKAVATHGIDKSKKVLKSLCIFKKDESYNFL